MSWQPNIEIEFPAVWVIGEELKKRGKFNGDDPIYKCIKILAKEIGFREIKITEIKDTTLTEIEEYLSK